MAALASRTLHRVEYIDFGVIVVVSVYIYICIFLYSFEVAVSKSSDCYVVVPKGVQGRGRYSALNPSNAEASLFVQL